MNNDAFQNLYSRQKFKQKALYARLNKDTSSEVGRDKIVLENLDHAIEEIVEARREIHIRKEWNPDKANKPMTGEEQSKCSEEIIDVLHFLMTSLIYLGNSYEDICHVLEDKMLTNDNRPDHQYEELNEEAA